MIIKNPLYVKTGTDVSDTTATAADVLAGKEFYLADGTKATGQIVTYSGSKNITPTEQSQTLSTQDKYVDGDIVVASIPSRYKDTTGTDAVAGDMLAGKKAVTGAGLVTGSIQTYSGATSITPTEQSQNFATSGKYVGSNLTVGAIPSAYKDTTGTDATAGDMLAGRKAVTGAGMVEGTIPTYSGATTITQNGNLATAGKYVASDIAVQVPQPSPVLIAKNITENGTYTAASDNADGYSSVTVNVQGGGIQVAEPNDVNFFDYDGTIVASYSASNFLAISSLPSNPSHTGLVAEGWNWTLADAKTYVASYGFLDIAQLYHTLSGAIEYDIEINEENGYTATLGLNGTQKDWGDGTTNTLETHTYLQDGEYTIKLSGSRLPIIQNSKKVVEVRLSNNVSATIVSGIFKNCRALRAISISSQLQEVGGDEMFYGCTLLKFIALPWNTYTSSAMAGCCSLSNYSIEHAVEDASNGNGGGADNFAGCTALQKVCLQGDTILGDFGYIVDNAFKDCISLKSVIIPDNILYIGGNAFSGCSWLTIIKIYAQTPPPLDSTNAFPSSLDKIYIPAGTLADYQSETNWSAFSAKFVEMTA